MAGASIMNVNSRDCPGLAITTLEGRKVGIYAQDGLGFILYDRGGWVSVPSTSFLYPGS